jgi:hypothetical protein
VGVKHKFTSLVANVGGPTYVQPTHWNDDHAHPPMQAWEFTPGIAAASFGIPSTAGPTGFEFFGNTPLLRGAFDFTNVDTLQMIAGVASAFALGSAALRFQYSPSGFPGSWYSFDATGGSAPFVSIASGNNASMYLLGSNGAMLGPSAVVSAAAKALPQPLDVRVAGYGGNGSAIGLGNIDVFAY